MEAEEYDFLVGLIIKEKIKGGGNSPFPGL